MTENLETKTVSELRELAEEMGIETKGMRKADLISLLEEDQKPEKAGRKPESVKYSVEDIPDLTFRRDRGGMYYLRNMRQGAWSIAVKRNNEKPKFIEPLQELTRLVFSDDEGKLFYLRDMGRGLFFVTPLVDASKLIKYDYTL